jgi:hypothetical protein
MNRDTPLTSDFKPKRVFLSFFFFLLTVTPFNELKNTSCNILRGPIQYQQVYGGACGMWAKWQIIAKSRKRSFTTTLAWDCIQ